MNSNLILIAGGSGSGKSTVAISLKQTYPERVALVHLDDYYKMVEDVPVRHGLPDWESPESLRFEDLYTDIVSLMNGSQITVRTKSELYNPAYRPTLKNKISQTIVSAPCIILEGYLSLYDARLRAFADDSWFLDMPIELSYLRRGLNKVTVDDEYRDHVLIPGYYEYVVPTRQYAKHVLDVSSLSQEDVLQTITLRLSQMDVLL